MPTYYQLDAQTPLDKKLTKAVENHENKVDGQAVDYTALSDNMRIGICERIGRRTTQEDNVSIIEDLDPTLIKDKSPETIAKAIAVAIREIGIEWDSYYWREKDKVDAVPDEYQRGFAFMKLPNDGSTVSATLTNGDTLITATLADAMSYLAVYDNSGKIVGVRRLNQVFHDPSDPSEKQRIKEAQSFIVMGRVAGELNITRAVGDTRFNRDYDVITDNPTVEINSVQAIAQSFGLNNETYGFSKVITCCDGLIEAVKGSYTKSAAHEGSQDEAYLLEALKSIDSSLPPHEVAAKLAEHAYQCSTDNISVIVQDHTPVTRSFHGVYDGHAGDRVSTLLAKKLNQHLEANLRLDKAALDAKHAKLFKNPEFLDHRNNHQPYQAIIDDGSLSDTEDFADKIIYLPPPPSWKPETELKTAAFPSAHMSHTIFDKPKVKLEKPVVSLDRDYRYKNFEIEAKPAKKPSVLLRILRAIAAFFIAILATLGCWLSLKKTKQTTVNHFTHGKDTSPTQSREQAITSAVPSSPNVELGAKSNFADSNTHAEAAIQDCANDMSPATSVRAH